MKLHPLCIHPVEKKPTTYKNHPSLDPSRIPWDYSVSADTPVMAINNGIVKEVVRLGSNWREWLNRTAESLVPHVDYSPYGYHVIIEHPGFGTSAYCHLLSMQSKLYQNFPDGIFVEVGEEIVRGQVIGLSGCNNITRAKEWAVKCDKDGKFISNGKDYHWSKFTRYNEKITGPGPDGTGYNRGNYDFTKGEVVKIGDAYWLWPKHIPDRKNGDHLHFEVFRGAKFD